MGVQVMQWLPQSPDLNIIESVWDYLDQSSKSKIGGRIRG